MTALLVRRNSSLLIGQKGAREMRRVGRFLNEELGTSMVEWSLLATLIVLVCIVAMTSVGNTLVSQFQAVAAAF